MGAMREHQGLYLYIALGMNPPQDLLKEIAAIRTMERGTLCRMGAGPYFNHQTWQQGRNCVRYVPTTECVAVRTAIAGYRVSLP